MTSRNELIVLLHGFAAHRAMMLRLQQRYRARGYRTLNWGYNSWFRPIEYHAARLHERIQELDQNEPFDRIHFVTHSMGCIVTRAALLRGLPKNCGRWVQLAPPNSGSNIANRFPRFVKRLLPPIDELQSVPESYVNQLAVPQEIEIAVVQATKDYIVPEPLTRLEGEKDRFVVPGLHSQILFREDVAHQTIHFLEHGHFASGNGTAESAALPSNP